MALIECPECKKQVSDAAEACPGCGYPLKKPAPPPAPQPQTVTVVQKKKTSTLTWGCLIMIILGIAYLASVCADIFDRVDVSSIEKENKKAARPTISEKEYIEIIEYPANLLRYDFKTPWRSAGKIPVGTRLEVLDDHVKEWSAILKTRYYKVRYKGVLGWVSEHACRWEVK